MPRSIGCILALAILLGAQSPAHATQAPANSFGQRLLRTLEFIDFPDVLVAIAAQNTRPWERYDQGEHFSGRATALEPRWNQAISTSLSGAISGQLNTIHGIFMESRTSDFRETPIDDAGGDIDRGIGGPGGFDRVTSSQALALQANPLLTVEIKADPYNQQGQTQLARYRYPSAGTYKKFQNRLSAGLVQDLTSAEQAGQLGYDINNPRSVGPQFRALNKRIIAELLDGAYSDGASSADNYQAMIAVHPFDDYNGRTLRAWYRQRAGRPMFLLNFYCDLYCSRQAFENEISKGDREYDLIASGLVHAENASPGFPRFYGAPEFWMVAADTQNQPADAASYVSRSEAWILRVENSQRIDHKQFDEVFRDYRAYLSSQGML